MWFFHYKRTEFHLGTHLTESVFPNKLPQNPCVSFYEQTLHTTVFERKFATRPPRLFPFATQNQSFCLFHDGLRACLDHGHQTPDKRLLDLHWTYTAEANCCLQRETSYLDGCSHSSNGPLSQSCVQTSPTVHVPGRPSVWAVGPEAPVGMGFHKWPAIKTCHQLSSPPPLWAELGMDCRVTPSGKRVPRKHRLRGTLCRPLL